MLQLINNLPPHVVGVHAFAVVTEAEYTNTLIPLFDKSLKKSKRDQFYISAGN